MKDEYDPLMFYRTTYGDLSPYASKSNAPKTVRKKLKLEKTKTADDPIIYSVGLNRFRSAKRRACDRKIRYETQVEVDKAIEEQKHILKLYSYNCQFCDGFHVSKNSKRITKDSKAK